MNSSSESAHPSQMPPDAAAADVQPSDIHPTQPQFDLRNTETELVEDPALYARVESPENLHSLPAQSNLEYFSPQPPTSLPSSSYHYSSSDLPGSSRPSNLRRVTSPLTTPGEETHEAAPSSISSRLSLRESRKPGRNEWTVFGELMGMPEGVSDGKERRYTSSMPTRPSARDSIRELVGGSSYYARRATLTPVNPPAPGYELHAPVSSMAIEPEMGESTVQPSDVASEFSLSRSVTDSPQPTAAAKGQRSLLSWFPTGTLSPLSRNILKCCIAYFIGSMFTYCPYLSSFIADIRGEGDRRPSPSGHMVATVLVFRYRVPRFSSSKDSCSAVYFNPAKTIGGMLEADVYCLIGLLYATFVSLCSMSMYWFFEVKPGWEWLADTLVILWVGVGMSGMAYMKMWMARPSFNTGMPAVFHNCILHNEL